MSRPPILDALSPADLDAIGLTFWHRVAKTDTCWQWIGTKCGAGYGTLKKNKRSYRAHRIAFQLLVGPIPDGLVLDHLCRNQLCVNPTHLEPVTFEENIRRAVRHVEPVTHCMHGHQFTPDNTKIRFNGTRKCRACDRDQAMKRYYAKKGIPA